MDCGFIRAGFEVVGANENDPAASITYMRNLGSYPMQIHYVEGEKDKEQLNKAVERNLAGKWKRQPGDKIYDEDYGTGLAGSGWIKHNPDAAPVQNFWFGDIRKLRGEDILNTLGMERGELDCVCGGPPCQGFSRMGKRNILDPRNSMVYEYARMIVELQPKTFVMENVPDIVTMFDPEGILVIDKFSMMVADGGYGKWKQIKQAMLMQAIGSAVVPKSKPGESESPAVEVEPAEETLQPSLF